MGAGRRSSPQGRTHTAENTELGRKRVSGRHWALRRSEGPRAGEWRESGSRPVERALGYPLSALMPSDTAIGPASGLGFWQDPRIC